MKTPDGGKPEEPWVLVAIKLYAQHGGSEDSKCFELLWGEGEDSLRNSTWTDKVELHPGEPKVNVDLLQ